SRTARFPTATTGSTSRSPTSARTRRAATLSSPSSTGRSDAAPDAARRPRPDDPPPPRLAVPPNAGVHGSVPGLGRQDRSRGDDRAAERLGPGTPAASAPARDLPARAEQLRLG